MIYDEKKNIITTNRLLLRAYNMADVDNLAKMCNNYNLYRYTLNLPFPYDRECAIKYINSLEEEKDNQFVFAITDKFDGTLYGSISLSNDKRHHNGEIGYLIDEKYWNNGYATEATKAIIEFAFKYKNYHRICARHLETNPASGKVMQKSGMTMEGNLKEAIFKECKYENVIYYGIVKESN